MLYFMPRQQRDTGAQEAYYLVRLAEKGTERITLEVNAGALANIYQKK